MKAGVFTDHGEVGDATDIDSCVKYCCLDRLCDVAYMVGKRCYTLQCFSKQTCRTFYTPNFILNPVMAFVIRNKPASKVDVVSLEFIKNNNSELLNSTFTNSSKKANTVRAKDLKKKTIENMDRPSIAKDGFVEDDVSGSGSGSSGIDSPGYTRDKVPMDILKNFEKSQEEYAEVKKERYYFPLSDVNTDVIQSLSSDKGT